LPDTVLALDLETTGLIPKYDALLGIGAAIMRGTEVLHTFKSKVRLDARQKISLEALTANIGNFKGSPDEWKEVGKGLRHLFDGVDVKDAVADFSIWLDQHGGRDYPVVAYNAPFDAGFYADKIQVFTTVFAKPLCPVWIDCLALARTQLNGKLKSYSLDALCLVLDLPAREPGAGHDPLQDAILCGLVYNALKLREEANK
jgi:DNA polymerase III epsilon subunit-like protein